MKKPATRKVRDGGVYKLQNVAIHKARAELEAMGVLEPWSGAGPGHGRRDKFRSSVDFQSEY